jgi:hypothetical protein
MRDVKSLFARNEVRPGMLMRCATPSQLLVRSPIARIEKAAPSSVSHSASAAAILVGCCSNMSWPCAWPVMPRPTPETSMVNTPSMTAGR